MGGICVTPSRREAVHSASRCAPDLRGRAARSYPRRTHRASGVLGTMYEVVHVSVCCDRRGQRARAVDRELEETGPVAPPVRVGVAVVTRRAAVGVKPDRATSIASSSVPGNRCRGRRVVREPLLLDEHLKGEPGGLRQPEADLLEPEDEVVGAAVARPALPTPADPVGEPHGVRHARRHCRRGALVLVPHEGRPEPLRRLLLPQKARLDLLPEEIDLLPDLRADRENPVVRVASS